MKVLITGCFGFIGFNFLKIASKKFSNDFQIIGIDSLEGELSKYNNENFQHENFKFYERNINNISDLNDQISDIDIIINFAAESHVDNSISYPEKFIESNVSGLAKLLMFAIKKNIPKFYHFSTDEIYGSSNEKYFIENDRFNPSSPYSASKASAELICSSFANTYGYESLIVRPSNNYGTYQQPEKLIPFSISNLLEGKNVELYGDGKNIRHWLHVEDTVGSILHLLENNFNSGVFNIGSGEYFNNFYIVNKIIEALNLDSKRISYVEDRPGHDFRYAVNFEKLLDTGWKPQKKFDIEIENIVNWYKENREWLSRGVLQVNKNRKDRLFLNNLES